MYKTVLKCIAFMLALFAAPTWSMAEDWTRPMFDQMNHDFGTVARGAKCEHRFSVTNVYKEDAHIESARASCGCTTPEVPVEVLRTWQKSYVVAKVDTTNFQGQKDVTITVVFDRPYRAEAQLQIHCYIRSDVVVQPGSVQFGSVTQGVGAKQQVTVSYAGQPSWQILSTECATPGVTAELVETNRSAGRVDYDLAVSLSKSIAPGYIRDQLYLVTNDTNPRAARVPVIVEGVVLSPVSVHPSPLYMGVAKVGESLTKQFVVRGDVPFKITKVVSTNPNFKCETPGDSARLLRLPVTFIGADAPGRASGTVRIETTASTEPLQADVSVDITAPTADSPPETSPGTSPVISPSIPPAAPLTTPPFVVPSSNPPTSDSKAATPPADPQSNNSQANVSNVFAPILGRPTGKSNLTYGALSLGALAATAGWLVKLFR